MNHRSFLSWFTELVIWLAACIIFACMAVVFEIPYILSVSVVCALILVLRLKGMQYVYEYQHAMIHILNEYGHDCVALVWIPYQRKAVVSGTSDILVNGFIPMKETMSRDELDRLLSMLKKHPEDEERQIYKVSVIDEEKYMKLEVVREYGLEAYLITDVTKEVKDRATLLAYTYYDMKTKLLSRDAFAKKIQEAMALSRDYICYFALEVTGMNKAVSNQEQRVDRCLELISLQLRALEKKGAVIGQISANKFMTAFLGSDPIQTFQMIADMKEQLVTTIDSFNKINNMKISFNGGVCSYPDQAENLKSLMSKADFALFESRALGNNEIAEYSASTYAVKEQEYIKIQEFNRLMNGNLFDYHFQPIVEARTGRIFAFEALMRPRSDVLVSPPDVLKIAEEEGRLNEIERLTMKNIMKILSENKDVFQNAKLFINSIPNCSFSETEFNSLKKIYEDVFDKVVIEITEERDLDETTEQVIKEYYRKSHLKIALDDYGSGYSNDSNLLKIQPDFVKIDRSLLINIDKDTQKYHLVGNMVNFAKQHGIMVIVEGLESRGEVEAVIALGADLIQGFYTAKPRPVFIMEISRNVSDELKQIAAECSRKYIEQSQPEQQ